MLQLLESIISQLLSMVQKSGYRIESVAEFQGKSGVVADCECVADGAAAGLAGLM